MIIGIEALSVPPPLIAIGHLAQERANPLAAASIILEAARLPLLGHRPLIRIEATNSVQEAALRVIELWPHRLNREAAPSLSLVQEASFRATQEATPQATQGAIPLATPEASFPAAPSVHRPHLVSKQAALAAETGSLRDNVPDLAQAVAPAVALDAPALDAPALGAPALLLAVAEDRVYEELSG